MKSCTLLALLYDTLLFNEEREDYYYHIISNLLVEQSHSFGIKPISDVTQFLIDDLIKLSVGNKSNLSYEFDKIWYESYSINKKERKDEFISAFKSHISEKSLLKIFLNCLILINALNGFEDLIKKFISETSDCSGFKPTKDVFDFILKKIDDLYAINEEAFSWFCNDNQFGEKGYLYNGFKISSIDEFLDNIILVN